MTCGRSRAFDPRARSELVLLAVLVAACTTVREDGVVEVTRARVFQTEAATPPGDATPGWTAVQLPDVWSLERRRAGTHCWYRTEFTLDRVPDERWAVYLPRLAENAEVRLNGSSLGDGGRLDPPVAHNWNTPLLFVVPTSLLRPGVNVVDVRLATVPEGLGVLRSFHVGPEALLRPTFEWRHFVQVDTARLFTWAAIVMAILMLATSVGTPDSRAAPWFAGATLLWGFMSANGFVRYPPISMHGWAWAQTMGISGFTSCLAVGVHRLFGRVRPRLERALAAYTAVLAIGLALTPPLHMFRGLIVAASGAFVVGGYALATILGASDVAERRDERRLLMLPGLAAIGFGIHDLLSIGLGHLFAGMLLSPFAVPIGLAVTAWSMLRRVIQALHGAERQNLELEARVREKQRELEQNYERVRALEQERLLAAERQRIMRDVHDGVGGQLVSTLAMVESQSGSTPAIAEALRNALDDLRLVIDSVDPVDGDLAAVLGSVRSRLEPRLERHGLRFEWQVGDLPPIASLSPRGALQVLRIVQEAITNVIKHSGAHIVTVRTGGGTGPRGAAAVFVEISDDGRGMQADRPSHGRGLRNMARRAAELGAELAITSPGRGTSICLWIPTDGPQG